MLIDFLLYVWYYGEKEAGGVVLNVKQEILIQRRGVSAVKQERLKKNIRSILNELKINYEKMQIKFLNERERNKVKLVAQDRFENWKKDRIWYNGVVSSE